MAEDRPQSRNEAIVRSTIEGKEYPYKPQSRMEKDLIELKKVIEEGGGGGIPVEANPEGEATEDLRKLKVGSTIYNVSNGGTPSVDKEQLIFH